GRCLEVGVFDGFLLVPRGEDVGGSGPAVLHPHPYSVRGVNRMGGFREMSQENPRPAPDLSALRIRREPEKSGRPKGWLFGGAIVVVAAGAAAWLLAGRTLRPRTVEAVTASVLT